MKLVLGTVLLMGSYIWMKALPEIWENGEPLWARAIFLIMLFSGEIFLMLVGGEINSLKEKVKALEQQSKPKE